MNVLDAIETRRTIRKFTQEPLKEADLLKIVNAARLSAYGANRQPLKYIIISEKESCAKVFPHTKWAGYLPDWDPSEGERPTAYIAILADSTIRPVKAADVDCGLAMTSMMLCAHELGIGSCAIGSIDREELHALFELDDIYHVSYLLALGYPAQNGSYFDMIDNNIKYYHDDEGNVHLPKRTFNEVLIKKI